MTVSKETDAIKEALGLMKAIYEKHSYKITSMLGEKYNEGMRVLADFTPDETLGIEERRITSVTRPEIVKDGEIIQKAQVTIVQGPLVDEAIAEVQSGNTEMREKLQEYYNKKKEYYDRVISEARNRSAHHGELLSKQAEEELSLIKKVLDDTDSGHSSIQETTKADEGNIVEVSEDAAGQRGQQGSTGNAATGKRAEDGERTADSGGRTVLPESERRGQGDIQDTTGRQPRDLAQAGDVDNGVPEWYGNVRLSGQLDQNNSPFVLSPDGTIDFGVLDGRYNLPQAPVRLALGDIENGYIHINRRHGKEIHKAGFNSIEEFVHYVLENFTRVKEGSAYENEVGGNNQTYLIQLQDKHNNTLFVQLSRDGSYWNVNSAGVFGKKYGDNKKDVWSASEVQNGNSAIAGSGSQSEPKTENGSTSNGTPPKQSADKGSEKPANDQTKGEKVAKEEEKASDDKGNVIPPSKRFNSRKADERYHKSNEVKEAGKRERALRDALSNLLREAGIEVIDDVDAGQSVLDMANDLNSSVNQSKKTAPETASPDESGSLTVISSADGAKVLKSLDSLAKNCENSSTQPKIFIGELSKALGIPVDAFKDKSSQYATFETMNGKIVTIRISNHNVTTSNLDSNGQEDAISIVVTNKPNARITNDGNAHVVEYYYNAIKLRKADGKPLADIVRSIKQSLYSGEYKDTTGLAERQEVNITAERIREMRGWHGSGQDFDRFETMNHLSEGEGSQSFGAGTYVADQRALGEQYAKIAQRPFSIAIINGKEIEWRKLSQESAERTAASLLYYYRDKDKAMDICLKREELHSVRGESERARSYRNAYTLIKEDNISLKEEGDSILYTVDIPDDNGKNYLDWDMSNYNASSEEVAIIKDALYNYLIENDEDDMYEGKTAELLKRQINNDFAGRSFDPGWSSKYYLSGADIYGNVSAYLDSDRATSEFLNKLGYTGIKVHAAHNSGDVRYKGNWNYVVFNDNDVKITDKVRLFRTVNGEAYGFTVGGKIYIDPRYATAETPIHEYTHLWADAVRSANPKEWGNIVELMKGTWAWEYVKNMYPELKTDDEIADEALAHFSGKRGAERLRSEQERVMQSDASIFDKAAAVSGIERVRRALKKFWNGVCDLLHVHFTTAEEVADRALYDFLRGYDPRRDANGGRLREAMGDSADTFSTRQKKAVEDKGTVMPGLNSAEVKVVDVPRHNFTGTGKQAINKARIWAEQNLEGRHTAHRIDGNIYEYNIDGNAVGKFLSSSSTMNSENLGVHLAVLKKLPEVIDNSIEAEEHPDYKKINGERSADNGIADENLLVHRMYGAVEIDGKIYRVKTTMHEHLSKGNAPHDYRVTKIELLISGSSTSDALSNSNGSHSPSTVTTAKLLQNVEKSHDKGKNILTESEKADLQVTDTNDEPTTPDEAEEGDVMYREVDDDEAARLDNEPTIKVYRAMQQHDGKLYPPMSGRIKTQVMTKKGTMRTKWVWREPTELGKWEQSEEHPETANDDGTFTLDKGNGESVPAAYNPYIHTSRTPINDQFASAWNRPELVTVEVEVPASELTSGYHAEKAKDSVGETPWKSGPVGREMAAQGNPRMVILSRWDKPIRIVPVDEVADEFAVRLAGTGIKVPFNTVPPALREALVAKGIEISEPEKGTAGEASRPSYEEWLKGNKREREGNGAYSDEELAQLNDPIAKWLGKSNRTKAQQRAFANRERKNMESAVKRLAKTLHLDNVNIVTDASTLEGRKARAKGFYDRSTQQITIVIPNHRNVDDVMQTLLHEAVAHYGLRQLFGDHFDTFLDNVFNNAEEEIRERIVALASKNGWSFRTATEEYLAGLAENTEFENTSVGWWRRIKDFFLDMLHKIGFENFSGVTLSDNELRYILWRSYENLKEPGKYRSILGEAEDVAKQYGLKVGNYAQEERAEEGVAEQDFHSIVDEMYTNPDFNRSEHLRDRYDLGKTPNWMKRIGITGDNFSLSFKNIKTHQGKDADHDLTREEWHSLPEAIQHPFLVTQYKGQSDRYRLYVNILHNGHYVAVGVDVKRINQGKGKPILEVNSIKTVFAKGTERIADDEVIKAYDEKITPEQEVLLRGHNFREYPSIQELSAAKVGNKSDTSANNSEKVSEPSGSVHSNSERRQKRNAINRTIDQAVAIVTGRSEKEARDMRHAHERERKEEFKEICEKVLSGDFNDVTLQLIDKYIDDATPKNPFGRRISQRLPQKMERGLHEGARANAVDALFTRICESDVRPNERFGRSGRGKIERKKKKLLEGWAKATGRWYTGVESLTNGGEPIGKGKDFIAYLSKDGNSVIKFSHGKNTGRFLPDIDAVNLFNYIFPNSAYTILGYGNIGGHFVKILEQPFVDFANSTPLNAAERAAYMEDLGFKSVNDDNTVFNTMILYFR